MRSNQKLPSKKSRADEDSVAVIVLSANGPVFIGGRELYLNLHCNRNNCPIKARRCDSDSDASAAPGQQGLLAQKIELTREEKRMGLGIKMFSISVSLYYAGRVQNGPNRDNQPPSHFVWRLVYKV
jgi:hypothetical protein